MLAFLHSQSGEFTPTVLRCRKWICKAKNHLAAFHREFLSSSINQKMQATIWCSVFSNCLCYLLPYVWIFSPAFFYLIYIAKFLPTVFPTKHLLNVHIRIVRGNPINDLTVSVSKNSIISLLLEVSLLPLHQGALFNPSGTSSISNRAAFCLPWTPG